jgi:hypothetical protein
MMTETPMIVEVYGIDPRAPQTSKQSSCLRIKCRTTDRMADYRLDLLISESAVARLTEVVAMRLQAPDSP